MAICLGMQKTLEANPNIVIAIEYAPQDMLQTGYQPNKLLGFFLDRGFCMYIIQKDGKMQLTENGEEIRKITEKNSYINLLFTRR
jgi:hypothetical protein